MSFASAAARKILLESVDDQNPATSTTTTTDQAEPEALNGPSLPHDIVVRILARLPTEDLFRFSSVSKLWLRTIKQPFFRTLHSNVMYSRTADRIPEPFALFRDDKHYRKLVLVSLPDVERNRPSKVLTLENAIFGIQDLQSNTCDGLVSVHASQIVDEHPMLVWNPMTGEYVALPISNPPVREYRRYTAVKLVPDPLTGEERPMVTEVRMGKYTTKPLPDDETYELKCFGLGFNPSTEQYKVVRVSECYVTNRRNIAYGAHDSVRCYVEKIEVYTMGADRSWRTVRYAITSGSHSYTEPLYVKGKLYWSSCADGMVSGVMWFDMATEKLTVMDPACSPLRGMGDCGFELVVIGGSIAVVDVMQAVHDDVITVWIMLDVESDGRLSWRKRCEFRVCRRTRLMRKYLMHVWECDRGGVLVFWFLRFLLFYDERDRRHWVKMTPDMQEYAGRRCKGYRPSLLLMEERFGGCKTTDGFAAKMFADRKNRPRK